MTEVTIKNKLEKYIQLNKDLSALRKSQSEIKKNIETLETDIKTYMMSNDMDTISLSDGQIVLYGKKVSQTFKKDTIVEKLTEKLKDSHKAEELTESIMQNKKFIVQDRIKAVIHKT